MKMTNVIVPQIIRPVLMAAITITKKWNQKIVIAKIRSPTLWPAITISRLQHFCYWLAKQEQKRILQTLPVPTVYIIFKDIQPSNAVFIVAPYPDPGSTWIHLIQFHHYCCSTIFLSRYYNRIRPQHPEPPTSSTDTPEKQAIRFYMNWLSYFLPCRFRGCTQ